MSIEKETQLAEGGLSRIWQHTQDDSTFAIVGSQDKDTQEMHDKELNNWISRMSTKYKTGYRKTIGRYSYQDGMIGEEPSAIIYNVPLDEVKKFAFNTVDKKGINQESIVWKDKDFFGILYADGSVDKFTKEPKNMTFSDVEEFGSRLANQMNHNKGKLFAFKFEQMVPTRSGSGITHIGDKNAQTKYETLFEMSLNEDVEEVNETEKLLTKIDEFIDDIYLLRKSSIMSEGEYGKGNMVFKELRNNGYLDKLKELKTKLTEKDMIVEEVMEDKQQEQLKEFKLIYPTTLRNGKSSNNFFTVYLRKETKNYLYLSQKHYLRPDYRYNKETNTIEIRQGSGNNWRKYKEYSLEPIE